MQPGRGVDTNREPPHRDRRRDHPVGAIVRPALNHVVPASTPRVAAHPGDLDLRSDRTGGAAPVITALTPNENAARRSLLP
jgi:hypothetical protein